MILNYSSSIVNFAKVIAAAVVFSNYDIGVHAQYLEKLAI